MDNLIVVFITCSTEEEAGKLSGGLIENNLAACVNITSVNSMFRWKGKMENQGEWLMIVKSVESNFNAIEKFIKANHSYECPEIVAMKVEIYSNEYADWVRSECETNKGKKL